MLAGEGLTGPEEGFVVDFNADPPVVTDGPYTEAKELFNGFWILDVSSKEEAKQWAQKCPLGPGVKLEVRRVSETEEFPQDNPWIEKEIQWRAELAEKVAAQAAAPTRPSSPALRTAPQRLCATRYFQRLDAGIRASADDRSVPGADPDGSAPGRVRVEHARRRWVMTRPRPLCASSRATSRACVHQVAPVVATDGRGRASDGQMLLRRGHARRASSEDRRHAGFCSAQAST